MKAIGIDFGIRDSVVAICEALQPRILANRENKAETRSVVGLKRRKGQSAKDSEPEILVGDAALDNWPLAPKDTIVFVRRLMGLVISDPEVEWVKHSALYPIVEPSNGARDRVSVLMGGNEYSPTDISAMILKKLKADAEFRLNQEVTHAVITVPAHFNPAQREATREAGIKAGLTVIKIVDEPIAAAISFGIDSGASTLKLLLVFNLGRETFDVSLLMLAEHTVSMLHIQGATWLGSESFDKVLVDHVVEYVKQEYAIDPTVNLRFMMELKEAAQKTRESLGSNPRVDLVVGGALQDGSGELIDIELEITRELYERMIKCLVDRTVSLTKQTLVDSETTPDQIDHVLMIGSSTGISLVQQAMEELFGATKILRSLFPNHCVALGAAMIADSISPKIVCSASVGGTFGRVCGHVNEMESTSCAKCGAALGNRSGDGSTTAGPATSPFHYGIASTDGTLYVLVRKGDPCPSQKPGLTDVFTSERGQRIICVPIYGGDDLDLALGNEKQGDVCIILPPGMPPHSTVTFKLGLDCDGILEPAAELVDGASVPCWIYCGEPKTADGTDRCEPGYWHTEGMVAMAAFLLREFSWALTENQLYYVQKAAGCQDTLSLFEQVCDMDEGHAKGAWLHIGRRAIEQLIQPRSRLTAEYLSTRLVEVERDFRVRRPSAQATMGSLIGELAQCVSIFEFPITRQLFSEGKWNF